MLGYDDSPVMVLSVTDDVTHTAAFFSPVSTPSLLGSRRTICSRLPAKIPEMAYAALPLALESACQRVERVCGFVAVTIIEAGR